MPQTISFSLTTEQFLIDHANIDTPGYVPLKTDSSRLGWRNLKPGTTLCGVRKKRGLKKGEKIERLGLIWVYKVWFEPIFKLWDQPEVPRLEGFPDMTPVEFVEMFCKHHRCDSRDELTRFRFRHIHW